jgi:hypothetical protein
MSTWQSEMVCAKNCITEILMCNVYAAVAVTGGARYFGVGRAHRSAANKEETIGNGRRPFLATFTVPALINS